MKKCNICNKTNKIHKNDNGTLICEKCYERPKKKCFKCGKIKVLNQKNPQLCRKCYKAPISQCSGCENFDFIEGNNLCKKCYYKDYKYPLNKCFKCEKLKQTQKIYNNERYCKNCWERHRKENDDEFRIKTLIRARMRETFKRYSDGQKLTSSKYGIDFNKIYDYIGKCPGERENYHLDHIFPISAFNLNDKFEIWAAFHPTNHQWLTKEENIIKSNKYDKLEFEKYLNKLKIEYKELKVAK